MDFKTFLKGLPWGISVLLALFIFITNKPVYHVNDPVLNETSDFKVESMPETMATNCRPVRYSFQEIHLGKDGPPIGYCELTPDGILTSKLYNLDFKSIMKTVRADENGGLKSKTSLQVTVNDAAPKGMPSKIDEWKNKPFEIAESSENSEVFQDPIKTQKFEWSISPQFVLGVGYSKGFYGNFGVGASLLNSGAHICHSISGPCNSKYKFLNAAVDYDITSKKSIKNKIGFQFSPVLINLHKITRTTNVYAYPFVGYHDKNISAGLGVSFSL